MIVAATLLCQRKLTDWKIVLPSLFALTYEDLHIYINVQYRFGEADSWNEMREWLKLQSKRYVLDEWSYESSWNKEATIKDEQDNSKRLVPICIARNMAIQYAKSSMATHLFFVDADVKVPENSIQVLLKAHKPIIGGKVPSRFNNKNMFYVCEGQKYKQPLEKEGIYIVDHTTCGFLLIERQVFREVLFSYDMEKGMSEDPLYGLQARQKGFNWFYMPILVAEHQSNNQ